MFKRKHSEHVNSPEKLKARKKNEDAAGVWLRKFYTDGTHQ